MGLFGNNELKKLENQANAGDARSQFDLRTSYYHGESVAKNDKVFQSPSMHTIWFRLPSSFFLMNLNPLSL